jgi:hypothetical protein
LARIVTGPQPAVSLDEPQRNPEQLLAGLIRRRMPARGEVTINNLAFNRNRVNDNTSVVGGTTQTQELVDYGAANNIHLEIQVIKAHDINAI